MSQVHGQTVQVDHFMADARSMCAELAYDSRLDDVELVIEQRVVEDDVTLANYHVVLGGGSATVFDGPAARPDIVIQQDPATALALQRGELHAHSAFLTGRLTVDGDVRKLLDHGDVLIGLAGRSNA